MQFSIPFYLPIHINGQWSKFNYNNLTFSRSQDLVLEAADGKSLSSLLRRLTSYDSTKVLLATAAA